MTTTLKKKKWNLLETCQKYALKMFWDACTWHILDDLIYSMASEHTCTIDHKMDQSLARGMESPRRGLTGGGGLVRVPNLRVCKHLWSMGGTRRRWRMNYGGSSAWTRPSAPECGDTLKALAGRPASDLGRWSSSKTAPGSQSTGSPAGRTPPHGACSMYSQANVRAGKVLRRPIRALPSVIVNTENLLREADGPVEMWLHRESASGGKVIAQGCASKAGRVSRWGARRSQAVTNDYLVWSLTFITHVITNSIVMWVILLNNEDWDCFKTPILLEILRIQNIHQVEHCAFLEVVRLFQSVECVRNKLPFRTVQRNQKSFPWMQD